MPVFFITSLPSSTTSLNIYLNFQQHFYIFHHYGLYASFPDITMAKETDFEIWGQKFVVVVVVFTDLLGLAR
jgi:hypothetical protein